MQSLCSKQSSDRNGRPRRHTPLISVIVPAHNCARFIGAALDSLITQKVQDIEVITVDDASTDSTATIALEYCSLDPRVRLIRRRTPSGRPAIPRNEGLREARGHYIAFLDADDVALPTRFESTLRAMTECDATLAFADMLRFDNVSGIRDAQTRLQKAGFVERAAPYLERVNESTYRCTPNFIAYMLAETCTINTQTVMFARSLLDDEAIWFDETLICAEDTDLFYRLASHSQIAYLNEEQTLYRVRNDSLTAARPEGTALDAITVRRANLERYHSRLSQAEICRAREKIAVALTEVGYGRWCDGRKREARAAYLESWKTVRSAGALKGYLKAFINRAHVVTALRWPRHALRLD